MSRGLVLVKWWLLALPHYLILSVMVGGGLWLSTGSTDVSDAGWGAGGLVGLFVLIAAVAVLFTGRHPGSLYGLILGMDRWSLRVTAYAALITDVYPPFRLDQGGTEPGTIPAGPIPPQPPDERGPDPTNSTGAAANFLRCSRSSFSTLDPSPPFGPSMRRHRMARASSARPSPPAHRHERSTLLHPADRSVRRTLTAVIAPAPARSAADPDDRDWLSAAGRPG